MNADAMYVSMENSREYAWYRSVTVPCGTRRCIDVDKNLQL